MLPAALPVYCEGGGWREKGSDSLHLGFMISGQKQQRHVTPVVGWRRPGARRTRPLRIRLTRANDADWPAQEATKSVTSTRFTVPAGVPAATVRCPATALPLPNTTKFCATELMTPLSALLLLTRKPAVFHVSDDSAHEKAGATPITVRTASFAGGAATVSSRIAEVRSPESASPGTGNWMSATLQDGSKNQVQCTGRKFRLGDGGG